MEKIILKNKEVVVDDDVAGILKGKTLNINEDGYAVVQIGTKSVKIHQLILGSKSGHEIDHINQNKLDNRRENLRFCKRSENMKNRSNKWETRYRKTTRDSFIAEKYAKGFRPSEILRMLNQEKFVPISRARLHQILEKVKGRAHQTTK